MVGGKFMSDIVGKIKQVEVTGNLAYFSMSDGQNYVVLLSGTGSTPVSSLLITSVLLAYQHKWDVKIIWDGVSGNHRIVQSLKVPKD
jgi:ferredoxin-NADP reductase